MKLNFSKTAKKFNMYCNSIIYLIFFVDYDYHHLYQESNIIDALAFPVTRAP
jgi:hypothetical protein